uniref:Uncharacterized protein n=1 Tax=Glossina brevipalpis TaxID=37001 RepID=A0A1A9WE39_9MUSC
MDILDIDEALKDDSFIFLEDKTHDDISNILQQWKSNNCLPPSINQTPQQPLEQAYKLDSRTFTRPKRKLVQNLESNHFAHSSHQNAQQITENPMLNLEIGGLVTTMQKSFLQDTSPPSFISLDASTDRMNNSLITSADFSNLNFLQSTNSLDFNTAIENGECIFNLNDKATSDGYTLSDMIRDRKALESLTMSGDGTLIKDSHIGQTDDISLNLSKTASGCSTMDNSTESVEGANRTIKNLNMDRTFDMGACNNFKTGNENINRTVVLADEMIGDITYNLVESGMYESTTNEKPSTVINRMAANGSALSSNEEKLSTLDEARRLSTVAAVKAADTTFDILLNTTKSETPEHLKNTMDTMTYVESTPITIGVRQKPIFIPQLDINKDINISPIDSSFSKFSGRKLDDTYDLDESKVESKSKPVNAASFMGKLLDTQKSMEMIDDIESPHEPMNKTYRLSVNENMARKEMQNVMDLAEAEANLLASNNNEEEFDHMLDEFSKVELNAEQLKMKKSLDSIKKRFNYSSCREKSHNETSSCTDDESHHSKENLNATYYVRNDHDKEEQKTFNERLTECSQVVNETNETQKSTFKECVSSNMNDSKNSIHLSNGLNVSYVNNSSNGNERLLSRRSRLYDDINLSNITTNPRLPLTSTSFTLSNEDSAIRANVTNETECIANTMGNNCYQNDDVVATVLEERETASDGKNIIPPNINLTNYNQDSQAIHYRLAEKRERDRDRFKTISITKNRGGGDEASTKPELNVPCIDDGYEQQLQLDNEKNDSQPNSQRNSRCDGSDSLVSYNNETSGDMETASKITTNYLTYRKPREKQSVIRNLPEVAPLISTVKSAEQNATKPRSLSRPRYISGLTKFSAVSKATSADELEKTVNRQINASTKTSGQGGTTKISANQISVNVNKNKTCNDLKSPMGIKSKSFHNLSGNITGSSTINSNNGVSSATKTFGLRKPSSIGSGLKKDDSVFKVPKLVSGIRAPGSGGTNGVPKRAGLVRPTSGYYSLNVMAKAAQHPTGDLESDIERHSPTDSMSSASSSHSLTKQSQALKPSSTIGLTAKAVNVPANLTKVTIGSTGIPKPSGLRPPTNIKRSGLPRPASFIKSEK